MLGRSRLESKWLMSTRLPRNSLHVLQWYCLRLEIERWIQVTCSAVVVHVMCNDRYRHQLLDIYSQKLTGN